MNVASRAVKLSSCLPADMPAERLLWSRCLRMAAPARDSETASVSGLAVSVWIVERVVLALVAVYFAAF